MFLLVNNSTFPIKFVIDTGFTDHLCLPPEAVNLLRLPLFPIQPKITISLLLLKCELLKFRQSVRFRSQRSAPQSLSKIHRMTCRRDCASH
jgi:hypothetical protein